MRSSIWPAIWRTARSIWPDARSPGGSCWANSCSDGCVGRPADVRRDDPADDLDRRALEGQHRHQLGAQQLEHAALDGVVEVGAVVEVAVDDGPAQPGPVRDLLDVHLGAGLGVGEHLDRGVEDVLAAHLVVAVPAHLSPVGLGAVGRHGRSYGSCGLRRAPRCSCRSQGIDGRRRPVEDRREPLPEVGLDPRAGDVLVAARPATHCPSTAVPPWIDQSAPQRSQRLGLRGLAGRPPLGHAERQVADERLPDVRRGVDADPVARRRGSPARHRPRPRRWRRCSAHHS